MGQGMRIGGVVGIHHRAAYSLVREEGLFRLAQAQGLVGVLPPELRTTGDVGRNEGVA